MVIKNYTYIQHKLKTRPWGCECQFTFVSELDGRTFNEVIAISSLKIEEKELSLLIEKRLKLISAPKLPESEPEKIYPQSEVDGILIAKKYLIIGQKFPNDLPTKVMGGK